MSDPLLLENQLCFPLYACAREVTGRYREFLDPLGITYTQYIAMMVLWEKDSVSVKELGDRLRLDSGTLSPMLKSLENKGFVVRRRSEADERLVMVSLTSEGSELKKRAKDIPSSIGRCLPLTEEEAKILYSLLYKILDS